MSFESQIQRGEPVLPSEPVADAPNIVVEAEPLLLLCQALVLWVVRVIRRDECVFPMQDWWILGVPVVAFVYVQRTDPNECRSFQGRVRIALEVRILEV